MSWQVPTLGDPTSAFAIVDDVESLEFGPFGRTMHRRVARQDHVFAGMREQTTDTVRTCPCGLSRPQVRRTVGVRYWQCCDLPRRASPRTFIAARGDGVALEPIPDMPTADQYERYRKDKTTIWVSKTAAAFLRREREIPTEGSALVVDRLLAELRRARRAGAATSKSAKAGRQSVTTKRAVRGR